MMGTDRMTRMMSIDGRAKMTGIDRMTRMIKHR